MATYVTIPEITDYEPIESLRIDNGGKTFLVVIGVGGTAERLHTASIQGTLIPLVVVTTDAGTYALDDVYVTDLVYSAGEPLRVQLSFEAQAVRMV